METQKKKKLLSLRHEKTFGNCILPADEDIKKLERRVQNEEKKIEQSSPKLPKK